MDLDSLGKIFSQCFLMVALLGLILYLPLKPHWSKIFSFWDAILVYCGIGAPALYIGLFIISREKLSIGVLLTGLLVGGGFAVAGLVTLFHCWARCSNLFEAICLPFIMLMMIGVFCLGMVCLMLALVGILKSSYFTWDSFE